MEAAKRCGERKGRQSSTCAASQNGCIADRSITWEIIPRRVTRRQHAVTWETSPQIDARARAFGRYYRSNAGDRIPAWRPSYPAAKPASASMSLKRAGPVELPRG
jgi:hypothetical protein